MKNIWAKLRSAFSVEEEKLSEEEITLVEKVARAVARRGIAAPALMFLESLRPLNFIGSQAMMFLEPMVRSVLPSKDYTKFAKILERREGLEALIRNIEKFSRG